MTADAAGNLYGTTLHGPNAAPAGYFFSGAVLKLKAVPGDNWSFSPLYNFCREAKCSEGASPVVLLVDLKSQIVYGPTAFGGFDNSGTVFTLTSAASGGWKYEVIYTGGPGWISPVDLIEGPSGTFFGTTVIDVESPGTVFELAKSAGDDKWRATILHNFGQQSPNCRDGSVPIGLVRDNAGNLFGAAAMGGSSDAGLIYELANGMASPTFKILHEFTCNARNVCTGGAEPLELIENSGVLYGIAHGGGPSTGGTIFALRS